MNVEYARRQVELHGKGYLWAYGREEELTAKKIFDSSQEICRNLEHDYIMNYKKPFIFLPATIMGLRLPER